MQRFRLKGLVSFALLFSLLTTVPAGAMQEFEAQQRQSGVQRRMAVEARDGALAFARTELFFGTARPDGVVTEDEFRAFVDAEITPRFPDGLTLLKGDGQFKGSDGLTIKEQSFVLILLYGSDTFAQSSRKIDRIRRLYKDHFEQ